MLHSIYEKIISWFIRLVWQTKISSKVDIREYHWYFQLFYYFLENSDLFQIKNPGHFFCKEVDSELSSIEHQHFQQLHDEINEMFNKEQMVQVPYIPVTVSLYNISTHCLFWDIYIQHFTILPVADVIMLVEFTYGSIYAITVLHD